MIVVRLTGGLGNQLFQYAFGRLLSMRHGAELWLDTSFHSNHRRKVRTMDLPASHVRSFLLNAYAIRADRVIDLSEEEIESGVSLKVINELQMEYSPASIAQVCALGDNLLLSGYWASHIDYLFDPAFRSVLIDDLQRQSRNALPPQPAHLAAGGETVAIPCAARRLRSCYGDVPLMHGGLLRKCDATRLREDSAGQVLRVQRSNLLGCVQLDGFQGLRARGYWICHRGFRADACVQAQHHCQQHLQLVGGVPEQRTRQDRRGPGNVLRKAPHAGGVSSSSSVPADWMRL